MSDERQVNKKEEKKPVSSLAGVICSHSGARMQPVYKRVFDKDSNKNIVKKVEETDLYEFIQASASSTDLALLQKRFVELGEIPAADPTLGSNDLSIYPSNIHELYSFVNDVNGNFAKLPESIQKIFGTKEAYYNAIVNGTYESTLIQALNNSKAEAKKANEEKPKEEKKEGNE